MLRTFVLRAVLFLCSLAAVTCPAAAAEMDCGAEYCFSAEEFSEDGSISGICITDLPENLGVLKLDSRILREGDVLTAEQVSRMTFSPAQSETDQLLEVGYLPIYPDQVAEGAQMTLSIRGKGNSAPVAEDSALETYKNLSNTGRLKVSDPEGEAMRFTITRQPRRGTVEIGDDGSFTYTPKKNKVGVDSFTYTAADPAGKTSREATVTITILKPSDASQYTDTLGQDCRFAAEWMRHTGIFAGEKLAQETCFSPEKEVTRGEFVTMLVRTLDIPTEEAVTYTGYEDEVPQWLQPYLAAAVRAGLTADLADQQTFGADQSITGIEAAMMLESALDSAEAFAQPDDSPLTRGEAAQVLYQASKLQELLLEDSVV